MQEKKVRISLQWNFPGTKLRFDAKLNCKKFKNEEKNIKDKILIKVGSDMRKLYIGILLILVIVTSCALPLQEMKLREKKEFEIIRRIVDGNINYEKLANACGPKNFVLSQISKQKYVPLLIEWKGTKQELKAFKNLKVIGNFRSIYSVLVPKEYVLEFVQSKKVRSFEVMRAKPMLNISNPAVNAPYFYQYADYNGTGAVVCISDTGVRETHLAFAGKTFVNIKCLDTDANTDVLGHGTHVTGIVASSSAAYPGIAKGVDKIVSAQIYTTVSGVLTPACAEMSLNWCFDVNSIGVMPDVANASWGYTNINCDPTYGTFADGNSTTSKLVDMLVDFSQRVIVFAAGNSGSDDNCICDDYNTLAVPGDAYNIISVGAVDTNGTIDRNDDRIAGFSSKGPTADGRKKPDIVAPGNHITNYDLNCSDPNRYEGITSTYYTDDNSFASMPGTSMAAPHVTGAVALLMKKFNLNWLQVKALLINSADDLGLEGWDKNYGWGYLNLQNAYDQGNFTFFDSMPKDVNKKSYFAYLDANEKVTLVWNRHCDVNSDTNEVFCWLSNLDIYIYDTNNALIAKSDSNIDNVEQAKVSESGYYKVVVVAQSLARDLNFITYSIGAEPYALAASKEIVPFDVGIKDVNSKTVIRLGETLNVDFNIFNNTNIITDTNSFTYEVPLAIYVDGNLYTQKTVPIAPGSETKVSELIDFNNAGTKRVEIQIQVASDDSNQENNLYVFDVNVYEVNAVASDLNLITEIWSKPYDQNALIRAKVFLDSNNVQVDANVFLYADGNLEGSRSIVLQPGDNNVDFNVIIPARFEGARKYRFSIQPLNGETQIADNNLDKNIVIKKVESAIANVLASMPSGSATKIDEVVFDVNVLNDGTEAIDVNVVFYIDNNIYDWNSLQIDANTVKTFKFSKIFDENGIYSYDLNFIALYDYREFDANNNIYSMQYVVIDANDVNVVNVWFPGARYIDRELAGNDFNANVTVGNFGTGANAVDVNVQFFIDGNLYKYKTAKIASNDYNDIVFTNISLNEIKAYEFEFKIEALPNERSTWDNNLKKTFYIDGNALRILKVELPDGNEFYYGDDFNVNVRVLNWADHNINSSVVVYIDNNALSEKDFTLGPDEIQTIPFTLTANDQNGEHTIIASIKPVLNEYEEDNNKSVTVLFKEVPQQQQDTTSDQNTSTTGNTTESETTSDSTSGSTDTNVSETQEQETQDTNQQIQEETQQEETSQQEDLNAEESAMEEEEIGVVPGTLAIKEYFGVLYPETLGKYIGKDKLNELKKEAGAFKVKRKFIIESIKNATSTYRTKVVLKIESLQQNIEIRELIEIVPKSAASDANEISSPFKFEVLEKDPVIKFVDLNGDEVFYYINKPLDENALKDFNAPAVIYEEKKVEEPTKSEEKRVEEQKNITEEKEKPTLGIEIVPVSETIEEQKGEGLKINFLLIVGLLAAVFIGISAFFMLSGRKKEKEVAFRFE